MHTCPHHRIINYNETSWKVIPNGLLTWAFVARDPVSIALNAEDKDSMTILASVTVAYENFHCF
jgi:hypothetical protein